MEQGNIEFLVDKLFDLRGFHSATRSSAYDAEVASFCDEYLADMAPFADEFGGLLSFLKQRLTELLLLHGEKRWKRLEMLESELQGRIQEVESKRQTNLADRQQTSHIASDRSEHDSLTKEMFKIWLSRYEEDQMRSILESLSEALRSTEEHKDDIAQALERMRSLAAKLRDNLEDRDRHMSESIIQEFVAAANELEGYRATTQEDWANIATLKGEIRRGLSGH